MSKKIQEQINILTDKLIDLNYSYYELNKSLIDDAEFDNLLSELIQLEMQFPQYKRVDSPTINVGGYVSEKFSKHTHKYPMLSLSNAFNFEDLKNFDKNVFKEIGGNNLNYFVEPKIDGLSISIIYKNGKFFKAVTRGDGVIGEDVTENVKQLKSVPDVIDNKEEYFEVRGEIYFPIKEFHKLNFIRGQKDEALFANPRNAAAGTLRQLDSNIVKDRNLDIWVYYLMNKENIYSHSESLEYISQLNFRVNDLGKICKTIEECFEHINFINEKRNELEYEIDGVVIKVNEYKYYDEIGYTSKFPKWAIAYKLPAEIKETKLLNIFPTVGRTGKITYNAELEEVILAGTKVQAATLHNSDFIFSREIKIGALVKVKKAGDIIPEVISVVKNKEYEKLTSWEESTICPDCKSELIRFSDEVDQYCINELCEKKIMKSLEHFVSRNAMNIEGLSEKLIEKFFKNNFLKNSYEIFLLKNHKEKILKLEKIGEKLFSNLIQSIEQSKENSLEKLLFGLGIRHVGKKTAEVISENYGSIWKIIEADLESLEKIRDVGTTVAKSVYDWFKDEKNLQLIKNFEEIGVNLNYSKNTEKILNDLISNKNFVITGTLSKPRNYFKELLEKYGAKVLDSVTKNVDYVLIGEAAGSKEEKAKKLNIKLLSEEELIKMIGE